MKIQLELTKIWTSLNNHWVFIPQQTQFTCSKRKHRKHFLQKYWFFFICSVHSWNLPSFPMFWRMFIWIYSWHCRDFLLSWAVWEAGYCSNCSCTSSYTRILKNCLLDLALVWFMYMTNSFISTMFNIT